LLKKQYFGFSGLWIFTIPDLKVFVTDDRVCSLNLFICF